MKKTTIVLMTCIAAAGAMAFTILDGDGTKTNRTGGHGESGCTCHSATTSTITFSSTPDLSAGYVAGNTYTIHLTVAETGKTVFGIDCQALSTATVNIGTLTAGTGSQKITTNGLDNITHIMDGGLTNNSHTFDFTWAAPASPSGSVTFYYSGVGGNHNNASSGDSNCKGSTTVIDVTGIAESLNTELNAVVFPNPVSDNLQVTFSNKEKTDISMDLIDINGNRVSNLFSGNVQGDFNQVFDISSYSKGVYFLKINSNESSSLKKIVIE